jgi:toxin ParE1/3/4
VQKYELTSHAEADLLEIWRYTAKTWGRAQADRYFSSIEDCFKNIAAGKAVSKKPLAAHPKLKCARCEHHYVFFLTGDKPIILAILHEKMDFIARLKKRLTTS